MNTEIAKKVLLWSEAGLIGALALKVFGVQIIQSWGAWWLLQIIIMLAAAALFIQANSADILAKIEEIQKKGGG